jgi:hypothetical protein
MLVTVDRVQNSVVTLVGTKNGKIKPLTHTVSSASPTRWPHAGRRESES